MTEAEVLKYREHIAISEAGKEDYFTARINANKQLAALDSTVQDWYKGENGFLKYPRLSLAVLASSYEAYFLALDNHARRQVGRFIQNVVLPVTDVKIDSGYIPARPVPFQAAACREAEGFFLDAYDAIFDNHDDNNQKKVTVYHDLKGPIMIQKHYDEQTGLTLRSIQMPDFVVPAGAIVATVIPEAITFDLEMQNTGEVVTQGEMEISTYQVNEILCNPIRLSPWAYTEPIDRAVFATAKRPYEATRYDEQRAERFAEIDIEDFRFAARCAMQMCGVELAQQV